jgi:hypothetical protein
MKPMDLNKPYSGWSLFVGGMYGSGKTTFLGDMLAYEQERGKVAYVMTPMEGDETKGGWRSIAGLGINEAYLVETYDDLKDLLKKFRTDRYQAVGVDQLCGVATLIRLKLLGENRMPNTTLKRNEDDQTGQQPSMQDMATSQKFIRPMMEWTKLEFLIPGLFDLCFHLDVSGYKEVMKRQLITRQGKQFGTKQRLPQSQRIDTNLEMTDDLQNWAKIIHHLEGGPAHG